FALGIPNALVKIVGSEGLDSRQAKKLLLKGVKITLSLCLVPMLLFLLGSGFLSSRVFENTPQNYFLIVSVSLPLFILHELFLYYFVATKNFLKFSIFMFFVPNVLLILLLYIAYHMGYAGEYTFVCFTISVLLTIVLEMFFIFELAPNKEQVMVTSGGLFKIASPMMFSGIMLYLLNWTDIIILGIMTTEEQVGIYNQAFKIGSVGMVVIISISTIITPKMAELSGKGDISGLKKLIHSSTRLVAILSLPIAVGLILLAPFLLSFFGKESLSGETALITIVGGVFFNAACGNVDQILNMSGNAGIFRNITVVCFLLNALLNVALIPSYGINGAAMASLITNVLMNIIAVYYIKKKLGFYTFV
ncbi:MAG TPA: polysaccharide biosynthesis C-terminal domain-containing protein, partial [Flavobacterium sp.]|nr:polysaccharide biosynthesis C-terminal domain-containing protein [Flavobacterium sp.]